VRSEKGANQMNKETINQEEVVVNKEFKKNLVEMIERIDGFDAQDFTIQSQDDTKTDGKSILTIIMNGTSFEFFASIPHKRYKIKDEHDHDQFDFSIKIECNPGEIVDHEMQDLIGRNQLLERIKTWLICLKKNIDSTYTHRKIEQHRELIEKIIEKSNIIDGQFTIEEIESLKQKLEQTQKRIEEQLSQQMSGNKELEGKLKQLETDFKELEKRLFTQSKKGWAQSWLCRALKWGLDPVNQQAMIETTKNVKALITDGN